MYILYGNRKVGSWCIVKKSKKLEVVLKEYEKMTGKEYYSYIIKEDTEEGDKYIKSGSFYEECKVEYVDNVKTDFQVNSMTFKPSRMKQKEELRRMTEDYLKEYLK